MNKNNKLSKLPSSQILLYASKDGKTKIEVKFEGQTVWLTQDEMVTLFDKGSSTIAEHIQNV